MSPTDIEIDAAGKMTEALETLERARGHLYSMHQLVGSADAQLDDALALLRDAGHHDLAETIAADLVGRNIADGRWTFQLVEEFDDGYWSRFRSHETAVRDALTGGRWHVHEARMKDERRSHGREGHKARPPDAH